MTFRPLEQAGLLEPYRVPRTEIEDLLEVARRDVKTAWKPWCSNVTISDLGA